ncbi:MFS transporter-4 [Coleophoma crateriformis]|uniref:MFS transporter-4 n=1 Tax=Coleophoma crateriformis TaxID=565419 RepID=A0A3D8RVS6_9HELO|nr:MFS transporter-4 [Coleophoma crateriformis]
MRGTPAQKVGNRLGNELFGLALLRFTLAQSEIFTFSSPDPKVRDSLVSQVRSACQTYGFFQITNHGITSEEQEGIFKAAKDFFALPEEEKLKIDLSKNPYHRGYEKFGAQMLEPGTMPETKEGLKIGKDLRPDDPDVLRGKFGCGTNPWPGSLGKEFQTTCMDYHHKMSQLAITILKILALGLGLDEDFFEEFCENSNGTLRFIHYPPSPTTNPKARGIGAHRDFGTVTLLMQDEIGGLQVLDQESQEWIDVVPIPGAYVVNLGNLMMRWTNHKFTSNLHRVINKSGRDRYSVPFFFNGDSDYVFSCLPGCENGRLDSNMLMPMTVAAFVRDQATQSYARATEYKAE